VIAKLPFFPLVNTLMAKMKAFCGTPERPQLPVLPPRRRA
jgi:hypothetical protein